uniref:hypothetical protein n=1 Tax=Candidatus Cryptobacteroides bacterium TaxID=3085639 RepID=UPI004029C6F6
MRISYSLQLKIKFIARSRKKKMYPINFVDTDFRPHSLKSKDKAGINETKSDKAETIKDSHFRPSTSGAA